MKCDQVYGMIIGHLKQKYGIYPPTPTPPVTVAT